MIIIINSSPRSGNNFLATSIKMAGVKNEIILKHDPKKIAAPDKKSGIASVTLLRNPSDCIPSMVYKRCVDSKIKDLMAYIEKSVVYYDHFLYQIEIMKPYVINFDDLTKNTKKTMVDFFNFYDLEYDSTFEFKEQDIFDELLRGDKNAYQHIPHLEENDPLDKEIRELLADDLFYQRLVRKYNQISLFFKSEYLQDK